MKRLILTATIASALAVAPAMAAEKAPKMKKDELRVSTQSMGMDNTVLIVLLVAAAALALAHHAD